MTNLFYHNLTAGWRNILKYKVQNTVSVLCLSVGIILFAITFYACNIFWQHYGKRSFDKEYIELYSYNSKDGSEAAPYTTAFADSVQHLPCVKSVMYKQYLIGAEIQWRTTDGKLIKDRESISLISADWLKENNFYSTITGKKVGTLKPGTVVMSENNLRERGFSKDNIIGSLPINTQYGKVSDVVISDTYIGDFLGIFVVNSNKVNETLTFPGFAVRLNEGATFDDLRKEMKTIRPDETIDEVKKYPYQELFVIGLILLLGSTVLMIGLSGYLKMQLQLFALRSREMALRRCNGAHPRQLFRLYCTEILLMALITAAVTALVAIGLQDFLMPILQKLGMTRWLYINLNVIYGDIAVILIGTFLVAIGISWFSMRRMLSKPLSQTVGRSFAHKSAFTKTMQVAQFSIAAIFMGVATLVYGTLMYEHDDYGLKEGSRTLKHLAAPVPVVSQMYPTLMEDFLQLPAVDKAACYVRYDYESEVVCPDEYHVRPSHINVKDSIEIPVYTSYVTNPEIFSVWDCKVDAEYDVDAGRDLNLNRQPVPIFAHPDEAKKMAERLGIKGTIPTEAVLMPDSTELIYIGFAPRVPSELVLNNYLSYYLVTDNINKAEEPCECIIKPKNNDISQLRKEMQEVQKKYFKDVPGLNISTTAFDRWGQTYLIYETVGQLCTLLVIVALLCIILTVYSSVSLETRGRQKEIAIRKVNGAKTKDIIRLLSRYYVRTLLLSFAIAIFFLIAFTVVMSVMIGSTPDWDYFLGTGAMTIVSILTISLVTALTVGQKIYKVSKTNAAEYLSSL